MSGDAVTVLREVHTELYGLFERVHRPGEDHAVVLETLMQSWTSHVYVETEVLLPLLCKHVDGGEQMAEEIRQHHEEVEEVITLLQRRKINSPDVPELVDRLAGTTQAHMDHADASVLPALRGALSTEQLQSLGSELVSDQKEHPVDHGAAPDAGEVRQVLRKLEETVHHILDRDHDLDEQPAAEGS